ncbi:MAG: aconitase X catalytic domain-containing protein [Candidatus Aenigmarchaeota archaeon]|nr:aconitase X catalytic domain-containing protein [Candidatus Aenigmarchaeota archaeon]
MYLTKEEEKILNGEEGYAAKKSMEILVALGNIYGAEKLIDVKSVQVAGVSYYNLGDAGLEFLSDLAKDGKVKVFTTLNPAGMDLVNWMEHKIPEDFAQKQNLVVDSFRKMGITISCTCIPYLADNLPKFGEHIAWSESSAVTFANSIIGARTNKEGGPSALAAAITGKTPFYGLHLDENRRPNIQVEIKTHIKNISDWGALGYCIGKETENMIPYITGIKKASVDELKSFSASVVTYGSKPLFHIKGITPEAKNYDIPKEKVVIEADDIKKAYSEINDDVNEVDFVWIGCPHCSIEEIAYIARLLKDKRISSDVEFWITTARKIKELADKKGYTKIIENAGGKFVCDTCVAVAPLKGRFKSVMTNSAKGGYYSRANNEMKIKFRSLEDCINVVVEK